MNNPKNPEIVATIDSIDGEGNQDGLGDRILGVGVRIEKIFPDGVLDLDIRDFKGNGKNLIVRISLPELTAAITSATLNRDDNLK